MKILFVSNFYPPYYLGGYELGCKDIVDSFRKLGHEVYVLTSNYYVKEKGFPQVDPPDIYRELDSGMADPPCLGLKKLWRGLVRSVRNAWVFHSRLVRIKPDVVFFWNLAYISTGLVSVCRWDRVSQCHYVFDDYLARANGDVVLNVVRRMFKGYFPRVDNLIFASEFLRKSFFRSHASSNPVHTVIHWGIDPEIFFPTASLGPVGSPPEKIRLLFIGQVVTHKGLLWALEAFAQLAPEEREAFHFSIYGSVVSEEYFRDVMSLVATKGMTHLVEYRGFVSRDQLPDIYRQHDVLLFPSLWEEPFAITPLEGLSSGLLVIGSRTGGTPEQIEDGVNGLLFDTKSTAECVGILKRIAADRTEMTRYTNAARRTVEGRLTLKNTVAQIESFLRSGLRSMDIDKSESGGIT